MSKAFANNKLPPLLLKGFWLNLPEATQRNKLTLEQLNRLGIASLYTRIEASHGTPKKAKELGLKQGEWGAWKSWLQMLKAAYKADANVIHLIEDDIEIAPEFLKLINWNKLRSILNNGGIVCTDGYCSPNQAIAIHSHIQREKKNEIEWHLIDEGLHTPCINSILLTPGTAHKLHNHLTNKLEQSCNIPPVDIAIGDFQQGWLTLSPFCTGPSLKTSKQSTIRLLENDDSDNNRMALTLLRCCLMSKVDQKAIANELHNLINSLPEDKFIHIITTTIQELSELGYIKPY